MNGGRLSMRELDRTLVCARHQGALWRLVETVVAWLPALLLIAPLVLLAFGAFSETWDSRGPRGFTFETFASAWTFARTSAIFSLWIAALSAITTAALAVPAAYLLSQKQSFLVRVLRSAFALPLVLPNLLLAMGLIIAFPMLQGTWYILFLAYVIQCLPFAIWPIATSLLMLDIRTLETVGQTLGAWPAQRFFWLVLPNVMRPAVVGATTAFVLVLAESSSSFFLASGEYQPFGVTLYNAFQDLDLRIATATTMLLIGMLAPAVLILEIWLGVPAFASNASEPRLAGRQNPNQFTARRRQ